MRGEQDTRRTGWLRVTVASVGDVVLFAALALALWAILPTVALGASPVIISGGSMAPLIRAGDVVLLQDTVPPEGEMFAPGTVVTFETTDATGAPTGELVTHRVTGLRDGEYVTRGDANTSDDPRTVHPEQLTGVGRFLVPIVGLPAHWARSGAWHLVLATVLGAAAALTASAAGRRRTTIEHADELTTAPPVEVPDSEPLDATLPAPVLAFELPAEEDTSELATVDDQQRRDPAAAQRAATIAARAARRVGAGLDRVRREGPDPQPREAEDDARHGSGGSAGSAPVAAIVALAVGLFGATIVPMYAAAAYVATTGSTGNSFSTAPPSPDATVDVAVHMRSDWGNGYCADITITTTSTTPVTWQVELDLRDAPTYGGVPRSYENVVGSYAAPILTASGHAHNATVVAGAPRTVGFCADRTAAPRTVVIPQLGGQTTLVPDNNASPTYSWTIAPSDPVAVAGPMTVDLRTRRSETPGGNVDRNVRVQVAIDGAVVSEYVVSDNGPHNQGANWRDWTVTLWNPLPAQVIGPDTDIEFRLIPYRLDLQVGGPTTITLPGRE